MICFGSDFDCSCTEIIIAVNSFFSINVHSLFSVREYR